MSETVLVIGATGNIGVSVITAAVRTGRKVLAIVRNANSEEKMLKHLAHVPGAKEAITTVAADVTSENGVQGVVDQVKSGKLPAFQHVYQTVGLLHWNESLHTVSPADFHQSVQINIMANYFAYRAIMPYLLEHGGPKATFTLITGAAGDFGMPPATAITQGALFSMANVAAKDNASTNVRCNEVYLAFRIDYDSVWETKEKTPGMDCVKTSDFAKSYEDILSRTDIKGCRQVLMKADDLKAPKYERKLVDWHSRNDGDKKELYQSIAA